MDTLKVHPVHVNIAIFALFEIVYLMFLASSVPNISAVPNNNYKKIYIYVIYRIIAEHAISWLLILRATPLITKV